MNIIQAINTPALFGREFTGPTWRAWRAFLAALFGLPLNSEALATYREHTGRKQPPEMPSREAALVIGRRGGKSRVLALIAIYLAAFRDHSPHLSPGERGVIAIIAADRKQARVILNYTLGFLRGSELLEPLIDTPLVESIRLTNAIDIEIHTGSIASPRGRTFVAVLCDEIAFWRTDEGNANPDAEVLAAVRPGLASMPNSILLLASSPYSKRGVLWATYKRHYGRDDSRVLVWQATTLAMNPSLDPAVVEAAYEDDPIAASAEYGAEFRNDIAQFIAREVVEACTATGRFELPPIPHTPYVAFVDPSGGSADSMTLAVAHSDRATNTAVLDALREARPPFSPEAVVAEFSALLKSYRISRIYGDRYAGEWPRERFRENGITYEISERTKNEIYINALPSLNAGKLELLDNPRLTNQLVGLERRTARGGRDSIDHAPNSHDDIANAALGALLLTRSHRPMRISSAALVNVGANLAAGITPRNPYPRPMH